MPESPYSPPQTDPAPCSVVITDANAFQMPHKCVVCGTEVAKLFSYTQDHLPFIGSGAGFVRTTQVSIPYCDEHRQSFETRFRKLRIAQGFVYAILVVCVFTIFFPPVREWFGWGPEPGLVSGIFGGLLFLFLVITIFCIKPFLYDVFLKQSGNRLHIKGRPTGFITNVMAANRSICE